MRSGGQLRTAAGVLLAGLHSLAVFAQDTGKEPEVRKAVPVAPAPTGESAMPVRRAEPAASPSSPESNPPWMDRLPPEMRKPRKSGVPLPSSSPPKLDATPAPPPSAPLPAATPSEPADDGGTIRLAPSISQGQAGPRTSSAILAADGFYGRKMFDLAVVEYEKYLIAEPHSPDRARALFRLAESHRFLENGEAARAGYERLLSEFQAGEFAGAGAYRLAEILLAEKRYALALQLFRAAAENARESAVKLAAKYYQASCLDLLGNRKEANAVFLELAETKGDNPYRDTAMLRLAEDDAAAGRRKEALASFEALSRDAAKPEMKAEATVKAGALAGEMGNLDRAKELFEKAGGMPDAGRWRGVAAVGRIRLAYQSGNYDEVARLASRMSEEIPKEAIPEALLLAANAKRQLGRHQEALEAYDRIMREYPKSDAAHDAQFQRLVCLSAIGDKDVISQIDAFLALSNKPGERNQAVLLKAEALFQAGQFKEAAQSYSKVVGSSLPPKLRDQALFKLGWSYAQSGDSDGAIAALSKFIETQPASPLLPSAYAQRARAKQSKKAYDAALKDFEFIIDKFPKSKERELSLQQKALIFGQEEKYAEMAAAFEQLLKDYPETKAAPQANFWIGWAAFEAKEYPKSIERLSKARETGGKEFADRATLRIILAYYYLQDRDKLAKTVSSYNAASVPSEVMVWLGTKYFDEGDFKNAEKFLAPLATGDATTHVSPDVFINLARARIALKQYQEALGPINRYLSVARDPVSRARGLIASAEVSIAAGNTEEARAQIEEILLLQPEGIWNAEGRILSGDLDMSKKNYAGAARAYNNAALLYDDPLIAPKALARAAEAYKRSGNSVEADKTAKELQKRFPDYRSGTPPRAAASAD